MSAGNAGRSGIGCLPVAVIVFGSVLVFLSLALLVVLLFGGGPGVRDDSVLLVDADADFPETPAHADSLFVPAGPTFAEAIAAIGQAASDSRIRALHVRGGGGSPLGWARRAELRAAIGRFADAGKPVTAGVETVGLGGYYLASVADRIRMHPLGQLGLHGIHAEMTYFGELLEKLGVEAQFEAIGDYKTAGEPFTRAGISDAEREQMGDLIADILDGIARGVSASRGLSEADVASLLRAGPLRAEEAVARGLVDEVAYADEIADALDDPVFVPLDDYADALGSGPSFPGSGEDPPDARVAVVHVDGAIASGKSRGDLALGRIAGAATIVAALGRAREDDRVDAIVLRVSSPGGTDVASESIWRAARLAASEKPVTASFGDVAASGGYWVATAARPVVAGAATVTGSIGILAGKLTPTGLLDTLGVGIDSVPENAPGWTSSVEPLDETELEALRDSLAATYDIFLDRVAEARGMTPAAVDAIGRGRVWSGERGMDSGLVDEIGGLRAAVRAALREAGLPENARVRLVELPEPPSLADAIRAELAGGPFAARAPVLAHLFRGGRLAILPFVLSLR